MNTCQASIKTGILLIYLGNPHHGYQGHENTTQWFTTELNKGGSQADEHLPPKYVSYNVTTETIIAFYWLKWSTYLSAF